DRQVTRSPSHRLAEGGQLGLALRVGAAQPQLLMEDAQMTLPIEKELVHHRLRVGETGQRNGPRLPLANPRGHPHAVGELRPVVVGNRRGGSLVIVEGVLGDPPQHLQSALSLLEERGEEFRVSSSVGEAREAKLLPWIDAPAAIAVVDDFYWRAVR